MNHAKRALCAKNYEINDVDDSKFFAHHKYNENARSMIDHFYDKLLRLGAYPIRNPYFSQQNRHKLIKLKN